VRKAIQEANKNKGVTMTMVSPDELGKWVRPALQGRTAHVMKSPDQIMKELGIAPEQAIKLNRNENPFSCSPKVNQALADYATYNLYPDDAQLEFRELVSQYVGTTPDRVVGAAGGSNVLDIVMRLFVDPGDEVINCVPTFGLYEYISDLCGAKMVEVTRDENFNIDVNAIKAAITEKTKLIFLCNPNNPTGNITRQEDLLAVAETGVPVLVDEAYYEFSGKTVVPFIDQYPNMMVARTLSKWTGMAGVRIGYGIFTASIANYLMGIKLPFSVSTPAVIALRASLQDKDYLMENVKQLIVERERLYQRLAQMDFLRPYPSRTNFIFCVVLRGNANEITEELKRRGILVTFYDTPRLRNGLRISVGKRGQNDKLIDALRDIGASLSK